MIGIKARAKIVVSRTVPAAWLGDTSIKVAITTAFAGIGVIEIRKIALWAAESYISRNVASSHQKPIATKGQITNFPKKAIAVKRMLPANPRKLMMLIPIIIMPRTL